MSASNSCRVSCSPISGAAPRLMFAPAGRDHATFAARSHCAVRVGGEAVTRPAFPVGREPDRANCAGRWTAPWGARDRDRARPGGLTRALLASDAASVTAVEVDPRAVEALRDL